MPQTIRFVLSVESADDGSLITSLKPLSEEDLKRLQSLPSGGLSQIPHVLFVETLHREAYTMAVSVMSSEGKSLDALTVEDIEERSRTHLMLMMDRLLREVCGRVLAEMKLIG